MFNATQFVIDKVRRITQINLATGLVDFTGTSVESPQIEFTGESTDKTDAQGVLLARFDTAKGVNFSGELSLLNLNLMGAQLGSEVQVAGRQGHQDRYAEARAHFCPRCRVHHERGQEHQRYDRGRR